MKSSNFLEYIKKKLAAICLTDRFLLIFMLILMFHTAHTLLFPQENVPDSNAIDVVVRTTSAAIFGYFIGGGFLRGSPNTKSKESSPPLIAASQNNISSNFERRAKQQIIIVAFIGGFSLLLLLLANHMAETSQAAIAAISQLRDFVSGSVGLLIGHSTRDRE